MMTSLKQGLCVICAKKVGTNGLEQSWQTLICINR